MGVWIAKGTKWHERDFVTFAGFRGFRDPKAHEATAAGDRAQVREIEAEIARLTATRETQFAKSTRLKAAIQENLAWLENRG